MSGPTIDPAWRARTAPPRPQRSRGPGAPDVPGARPPHLPVPDWASSIPYSPAPQRPPLSGREPRRQHELAGPLSTVGVALHFVVQVCLVVLRVCFALAMLVLRLIQRSL